jgi:hypothetical protein
VLKDGLVAGGSGHVSVRIPRCMCMHGRDAYIIAGSPLTPIVGDEAGPFQIFAKRDSEP